MPLAWSERIFGLHGFNKGNISFLKEVLSSSNDPSVKQHLKVTMKDALRKVESSGRASEIKRFVNVAEFNSRPEGEDPGAARLIAHESGREREWVARLKASRGSQSAGEIVGFASFFLWLVTTTFAKMATHTATHTAATMLTVRRSDDSSLTRFCPGLARGTCRNILAPVSPESLLLPSW